MPFRDAYKSVGIEVNNHTFATDISKEYDSVEKLKHTHIGSIGNLCNERIAAKMDDIMKLFLVQRVAFTIKPSGLDDGVVGIAYHFNCTTVLPRPFITDTQQSFGKICCKDRACTEYEFLYLFLLYIKSEFSFESFVYEKRRADLACTTTGGTNLGSLYFLGRTHLWRVICIKPNLVRGRMVCFALSEDITSVICL